ncbi:hypothetical protein BDV96DRAFT_490389 [Lophiotrema nucula]|uniref:NACHT domain-containing protein n=1 Tax=Lophiotrema nucula TaxID=690887 RepID=A0A6A5ZC80_9PLEO|nr:hypothetical protein BDV96DRAFT_490389 [Lophiotrema nucula]
MKPLPAVGLASSILQIVDFGIKITSKEHKIYQPTESQAVENHAVLQAIVDYLFRLGTELDQNDLKRLSADSKSPKLSEAALQLLKLSDLAKEHNTTLIEGILQAQARGSYGDPKWQTGREALMSVWKKKDVKALKKKLQELKKEVDTALLIALRQYLDQSAETGLPVFSDDNAPGIHHTEKWQNEAMDAIHVNDWKPKSKKNVEEFSKHTQSLVLVESEARFAKDIFGKLYFPVLDDRVQNIPAPLDGTFEWLFEGSEESGTFMNWLASKDGQNLFWVTGNPGSGKSVLTKFLFRNSRTFPSLEAWSGASPGITAGFFFWKSGIELQKSSLGLLRSLLYESLQDMLYGPLQQDPGIIHWLFSDRWQQFISYGGGLGDFTFADIRKSFDLMIADASKKFLFVIDGLDELDGYPDAVVDLLLGAVKRNNVKIIASSRQSPAYQNAFEKRPALVIDRRANDDIQTYVKNILSQDEKFRRLRSQHSDEKLEMYLIKEIVHKADGVILWAVLATENVLYGIGDLDDLASLQSRVESLPADMDGLLLRVYQSINPDDLQQAARLFSLVNAHGYPDLLGLSFANDTDTKSSLSAEVRLLKDADLTQRIADMMLLLQNQCRGFLSIFEVTPEGDDEEEEDVLGAAKPDHLKVNYRHRIIRDFILEPKLETQLNAMTLDQGFDTDEQWANASLWALKTLPAKEPLQIWDKLAWCIEYALRLEEKDGKVRLTYLDEVGRAAINERQDLINSHSSDLPDGATAENFLDIAVWLNLIGYVRIKAKDADRKVVKHAIEYHRTIKKRLGQGGEEKWIGDRRRLKIVYVRTAPELDNLLDYYAKPAISRMTAPKPFVEVQEFI